ncbi:helix-turn-helix domain-containing protein [Streptomyces pseudovenezuelae]|uniref:DNA-binding protein n=1 Tax=Streptomyces pseudovenezuelae TaxID=67350 RepID=A0A101N0L2_9ACTN|nr:pyridoxamine 5'-phosphate oxidase family protein [Streptomyces pseudovenezuelae]KUM84341.1 DNA-binding protein [Streptomyces pseudovenezuelae]
MREHASAGAAQPATGLGASDLGRRLADRRGELGLTRQEVVDRTGMDTGYLRCLEETPAAAPGVGTLLRLADALDTGVTVLTGGEVDLPPGPGRASRTAESVELGTDECWERLSTHGVGRLGMITAEGVTILPLNYTVVDGAIVFRTAPGSLPGALPGEQVAFEADHIDEVFRHGWSVLVRGLAREVTWSNEVRRLAERAYSEPWAGGRPDLWVRLDPVEITGRLIRERPPGGG